jgi:hypothetical protein
MGGRPLLASSAGAGAPRASEGEGQAAGPHLPRHAVAVVVAPAESLSLRTAVAARDAAVAGGWQALASVASGRQQTGGFPVACYRLNCRASSRHVPPATCAATLLLLSWSGPGEWLDPRLACSKRSGKPPQGKVAGALGACCLLQTDCWPQAHCCCTAGCRHC